MTLEEKPDLSRGELISGMQCTAIPLSLSGMVAWRRGGREGERAVVILALVLDALDRDGKQQQQRSPRQTFASESD